MLIVCVEPVPCAGDASCIICTRWIGREVVGVQSCMHNVSALNHPQIFEDKAEGV